MANRGTTRLNLGESSRVEENPRTPNSLNREQHNDRDRYKSANHNERVNRQRDSRTQDRTTQNRSNTNRNNTNINGHNQQHNTNEGLKPKAVKDTSNKKENYNTYLSKAIISLEEIYDIIEIKDKPIKEVFDRVLHNVKVTNEIVKNNKNVQSAAYIGHIQIIGNTLEYHRVSKVNFRAVPNLRRLVDTLSVYLYSTVDVQARNRKLNVVLTIVQEMEYQSLNYHSKIAYRLLRVFCVMIMYGNYVEASVLAKFMLIQIQLASERGNI
ncbi:hypothetical protein [Paraclostridium bifermentans]|uniref:hypothetical protein n=1 Tax=Paraclostridium bifermentans TaxID=1490 RepID=UPI00374E73A7